LNIMKKGAIFLVTLLLVVSYFIPMATGPIDGEIVTKFSDGSDAKNITIPVIGGSDGTNSIELPKNAQVTEARFNVTGLPGTNGASPSGVSIDVGNDGDFEWNFTGASYGALGNQSTFNTSYTEETLSFESAGFNESIGILLPKEANVISATLNISSIGGGYIVINEFDTGNSDWAEVYNYGPPQSMTGWTWFWEDSRSSTYTGIFPFPSGFTLGTGAFVTIHETSGTNTATDLYMGSNMMWINSVGISGEIRDNLGAGVDFFKTQGDTTTPTSPGIWNTPNIPTPSPNNNVRRIDDTDDDDGNDWATGGTVTQGALNPGQTGIGTGQGGGSDNATIDIGANGGIPEWTFFGNFTDSATVPDFSLELNTILSTSAPTLIDEWGNEMVEIPINVSANSSGLLRINQMNIIYNYTTTVDINPFTGNLTNEINYLLPHTGEGNMTIPIMVSCATGGVVNISNIFIDYFVPPVTNDALYLLDGHGTDGKTCYSKYENYTFRANVSSRNGYHDISNVTLTLGLGFHNIELGWNRTTDTFFEVNDPNDYVTLIPTLCTSWSDLDTKWSLEFEVDLHWSYPDEVLTTCQLNTSSNSFFPIETTFFEIFRVENDLDFIGTLSSVAAVQSTLISGDWVLGNETINWTGLTVVYQGTTNIFPADEYFNVTITNNTGFTWVDTPSSGIQFDIESQVEPKTDHSDIHSIDITDIPGGGLDISTTTFEIKVDATAPVPPSGIVCHADGPGVGSTVWDKDTTVYVSWAGGPWQDTQSGKLDDAMAYNDPFPMTSSNSGDTAVGEEGNSTFYVRTRDVVGNWGVASSAWIFVDLTPIIFTEPTPDPLLWHTDDIVEVGVRITDTGGSGVAASSIQYRYTGDSLLDNEIWSGYGGATDGETLVTAQMIDFGYDGDKLFQWRAKDVAKAQSSDVTPFVTSPPYPLRIDTTSPTVDFVEPLTWQKSTTVTTKLFINDTGGSFVDKSTIDYMISTTGPDGFGTTWTPLGEIGQGESVTIEIEETFIEGTDNYIKWRAKDVAGNEIESDLMQIKVDTMAPSYSDVIPSSDMWQLQKDLNVAITLHDNNSGLDFSSMEYRITKTGPTGFLPWAPIPLDAIDMTNSVRLGQSFSEGIDNAIQWRVKDVAGNVLETLQFTIMIDTSSLTFDTPMPNPDDWQLSKNVECMITMNDEGSGIDVDSIQYSISTSGRNGFGDWEDADLNDGDANEIDAALTIEFEDGTDNYIQWRAKDVAGNDYEESEIYRVQVDTTPVEFSDPLPDPGKVHISVSQIVGITIKDSGSGVEPSTIFYSLSFDGGSTWEQWTSADLSKVTDPSTVKVMKTLDLPASRDIFVKWKVSDVAGNERISEPFNIQIDAPPIARINSPSEGELFNTSSSVFFDAGTSFDPDGDDLAYSWNIEGKLHTTITYETILSLGLHSIGLTVTDSYGLSSFAIVNITIVKIEVSVHDVNDSDPSDDGIDDGIPDGGDGTGEGEKSEGDDDNNLWWLILIAIIVIACILILLLVKKKKPEEQQPQQPVLIAQPPVQAMPYAYAPVLQSSRTPEAITEPDLLLPPPYSVAAEPVAALPPARITPEPYQSEVTETSVASLIQPIEPEPQVPEVTPAPQPLEEPATADVNELFQVTPDQPAIIGTVPTTEVVTPTTTADAIPSAEPASPKEVPKGIFGDFD